MTSVPAPESAHDDGEVERAEVTVRRAPRMSMFILLGIAAGLIAALLSVTLLPVDELVGTGPMFGFLALLMVPIGIVVFAGLGLLLDWRSRRRARTVTASKIHVSGEPDPSPAPEQE